MSDEGTDGVEHSLPGGFEISAARILFVRLLIGTELPGDP